MPLPLPIRDNNSILEEKSEIYFRQLLPKGWIADKPTDFGIDLNVGIVQQNQVTGLSFSVQLKATTKTKGHPKVALKTSTINYLLNRLEPVMIVLYVQNGNIAYWKWLKKEQFNLEKNRATRTLKFDTNQRLDNINWTRLYSDVQRIFKIQKQLLTSLEYDLFSHSELESRAWAHYFNHNYHEASFYFNRLLENEANPLTLLALAQCEYALYDYSNALMHINRALELEQSLDLLSTKGIILAEDGILHSDFYKLKQAETIFEKIYNENPNDINAYNYANTLSNLNQLEKAEELYKKSVELNPSYAEAWKNLGQLYYYLGKHKKELQCYEKALKINPNLPEARISKGITLSSIYDRHDEAIEEMTEGIKLDEKIFIRFPLIYYWMSRAYYSNNNISEALSWANKGLNHYPGHFNIREAKARILINNLDDPNLIDEAHAFFEEGRKLTPKDSLNFYYWCLSLLKLGKEENVNVELCRWLNINLSLRIDPDFLRNFSKENILLIPKHWQNTAVYFGTYDLKDVPNKLRKLENVQDYLNHFLISRAIFISLIDIDFSHKKTTKENIDKSINQAFYPLPLNLLARLITASKENPEQLADQISTVIVSVGVLHVIEISQCVGFLIGKTYKRHTQFTKLIDGAKLHKDFMIACTEILNLLSEKLDDSKNI